MLPSHECKVVHGRENNSATRSKKRYNRYFIWYKLLWFTREKLGTNRSSIRLSLGYKWLQLPFLEHIISLSTQLSDSILSTFSSSMLQNLSYTMWQQYVVLLTPTSYSTWYLQVNHVDSWVRGEKLQEKKREVIPNHVREYSCNNRLLISVKCYWKFTWDLADVKSH